VERRGQEAFKVTPTPQEATGQYLLMAYLIKTKIWHGAAEFDKGLDQLERYLESEGQTVFDV